MTALFGVEYEEIERAKAKERVEYIIKAINRFPNTTDPILEDTDLLELLKMADFARGEISIRFKDDKRSIRN